MKKGFLQTVILRWGESLINFFAWISIIVTIFFIFSSLNVDGGAMGFLIGIIAIILEILFYFFIFVIIDMRNSLNKIVELLSKKKGD